MFCRHCWANVPDETPSCPRCQKDLTAPPPPPFTPPLPQTTRDPTRRGLDVLLVVLLLVFLGAGWFVATQRWERSDSPRASAPVSGSTLPGSEFRSLPSATSAVAEMNEAALASLRQGRVAEACRLLTGALELEPDNTTLQGNLVHCLAREGWEQLDRGEIDKARALFEQGLTLAPSDAMLLGGLGMAHLRNGDRSQGLSLLEEAQRAAPETNLFRLTLARLSLERDEMDRAIVHLRALLAQEPGHAEAQRLLARLEREQVAEAGYFQDESRHFIVRYRGRDSEIRRAIRDGLERAYDRISRELDVSPREKIAVVLYPEVAFREVTLVHPWTQAVFDGKIRIPVLSEKTEGLDRLLAHELTHALIYRLSQGRVPLWLHEGLAQQLEGGGDESRLAALRGVPRGEALSLDMVDSFIRSSEEERVRRGYLLAWSGVRFLLDRRGMDGVRKLLERLGQGESWETAFQAIYGQPFPEFTREWAAVAGRG